METDEIDLLANEADSSSNSSCSSNSHESTTSSNTPLNSVIPITPKIISILPRLSVTTEMNWNDEKSERHQSMKLMCQAMNEKNVPKCSDLWLEWQKNLPCTYPRIISTFGDNSSFRNLHELKHNTVTIPKSHDRITQLAPTSKRTKPKLRTLSDQGPYRRRLKKISGTQLRRNDSDSSDFDSNLNQKHNDKIIKIADEDEGWLFTQKKSNTKKSPSKSRISPNRSTPKRYMSPNTTNQESVRTHSMSLTKVKVNKSNKYEKNYVTLSNSKLHASESDSTCSNTQNSNNDENESISESSDESHDELMEFDDDVDENSDENNFMSTQKKLLSKQRKPRLELQTLYHKSPDTSPTRTSIMQHGTMSLPSTMVFRNDKEKDRRKCFQHSRHHRRKFTQKTLNWS